LASLFIAAYLGVLGYGVACHALSVGLTQHTAMYFIIWDMFCGWSAYANAIHIVGEGESGNYYQISPAPWGDFIPYGSMGRQHYDSLMNHAGTIAMNTLKHTKHEPMVRVFVVEELWAKKYDMPDYVWNRIYEEPKDVQRYYRVRTEMAPCGSIVRAYSGWLEHQAMLALIDNPRLRNESRSSQPFFVLDNLSTSRYSNGPGPGLSTMEISAPLGN